MDLIVKKTEGIEGNVKAPPSKSYTHRAVIIASLADNISHLKNPLVAKDTCSSVEACEAFGAKIDIKRNAWIVKGVNGKVITPENVIDVGNSGTTLRIMTAVAGLAKYYTILTGDKSIRSRPMQPLLDSLRDVGVVAFSSRNNGRAPIIVKGGYEGGYTEIPGNISSQFISALLIIGPYGSKPLKLKIIGELISKPYVDMTVEVMKKFDAKIEREKNTYYVEPNGYKSCKYSIEGDFSSASYIVGATAIAGGKVSIKNLFKDSKQADKLILDIISEMGVDVKIKKNEIIVCSDGELHGIDVNLKNSPDLLPTVAVLGAAAKGRTKIYGIRHARFKETDRIAMCAKELSKLGIKVKELDDGLIINGGNIKGGIVDSHNDHRLVMALTLLGLKKGIKIKNAEAYKISFPDFVKVMKELGCKIVEKP